MILSKKSGNPSFCVHKDWSLFAKQLQAALIKKLKKPSSSNLLEAMAARHSEKQCFLWCKKYQIFIIKP